MPHLAGDAKAALMQMLQGELAHRNGEPAGLRHGVRRWDGTAGGALWAERNMQAPDGLTRDEIDAGRAYIKSPAINAALRGKVAATDDDRAQAAALDAAMAKSPVPQPILVTRGTSAAALEDAFVQGRDDDEGMLGLVGQVLTEPGYVSTSISSEPPQDFAVADVQWLIRVPRDTPALYLGVPPFDTIDGEQELLLGRNQRLLVHAVYRGPDRTYRPQWGAEKTISGQWFVEAEIVPADWKPDASWTSEPYGDAYAGYGDGSNAWMECPVGLSKRWGEDEKTLRFRLDGGRAGTGCGRTAASRRPPWWSRPPASRSGCCGPTATARRGSGRCRARPVRAPRRGAGPCSPPCTARVCRPTRSSSTATGSRRWCRWGSRRRTSRFRRPWAQLSVDPHPC
ncbi:ADP-ribosyltransferase [Micromonospora chersina]|uniref:ADP-ribosyltransferase n=1 Tax=Micromonospora chersina TaxID=47854 RepID=UPI0033BBF27D